MSGLDAATFEETESQEKNGTGDSLKHAHCLLCFPHAKPGDRVMAICGTVKVVLVGRMGSFLEPPPDACIVCRDKDLVIAHMKARHGKSPQS